MFRAICRRLGADLAFSEMISAKGLAYGNAKTDDMLFYLDEEAPLAVQLFGHEPDTLAAMAALVEGRLGERLALIDINMGCPARKVAGKGDGAALMRDPRLAHDVIRAVACAVKSPVTVKFRRGYEIDEDIAVDFARMAEGAGAAAIAVHGRTARQLFHGRADRDVINRVVDAVGIPVIASGDVYTREDMEDYFSRGASGVMVARGARGNPWVFRGRAESAISGGEESMCGILRKPTALPLDSGHPPCEFRNDIRGSVVDDTGTEPVVLLEERVAVAWEHASRLHGWDPHKLVSMRRHIAWYFKGTPQAAAIRRTLNGCRELKDYQALLESVIPGC